MPITNIKSLPDFKLIPYENSSSNPNLQTSPNPDITVLRTSSWTYCGPLLSLNPPLTTPESDDNEQARTSSSSDGNFPPSYHTWHQATIEGNNLITLLKPFLEFAHEFIKSAGLEHYWLTIRATLPTDDFNTPRWHTDDDFFDSSGGGMRSGAAATTTTIKTGISKKSKSHRTQWKLASTLLGPGTLFATDGSKARAVQNAVKIQVRNDSLEHTCASVICLGCANMAETVRQKLAERLKSANVVQSRNGECCFFKVGAGEGAVHSEPPMGGGQRVFVNVVPGKEEELREVMVRWGMEEFPRAWCLGVPLGL
ncbi:hypothetical protein ABW20_dc0100373 [Dactylellina cionopaga]|nr:hypothetical protein ABW20_dc0100373 [Dactylellina cionopaga]